MTLLAVAMAVESTQPEAETEAKVKEEGEVNRDKRGVYVSSPIAYTSYASPYAYGAYSLPYVYSYPYSSPYYRFSYRTPYYYNTYI